MSRGGSDATVAREFDLDKKAFVPESEDGFVLPEAKSDFCYRGRDTLLVGGVFGDGEQTDSGYSRTVRASSSVGFGVQSCCSPRSVEVLPASPGPARTSLTRRETLAPCLARLAK